MLRKDVGDIIRQRRSQALLSQEELALKADLTVRTVNAIESGAQTPTWKTLRALGRVLDLDGSDFTESAEVAR